MKKFESMDSIAQRLAGTGGGSQAKAVIEAIKLIQEAPGMLDAENRAAALYHLAVALSGKNHAESTIEATACLMSAGT